MTGFCPIALIFTLIVLGLYSISPMNRFSVAFFVFSFIFSFSSYGQNKTWFLGVKLLPELTTSIGKKEDTYSRISAGEGLQAIYFLSNRVALETGIYYQSRGFKSDWDVRSLGGGDPIVGLEDSYTSTWYFGYLSIPALFRYHFNSNWYGVLGPSADLFLSGVRESELVEERKLSKEYFRAVNIAVVTAVGYQFNFSKDKRWRGFVEARVNPMITEYQKELDGFLISYGLGLGINYRTN